MCKFILNAMSLVSALCLVACIMAVLALCLMSEFAGAASFGMLGVVWFILLVTTGYANVRLNS